MSTETNINYASILIGRLRTALKGCNGDGDVTIPAWLVKELTHLAIKASLQINKEENQSH